MIRLFPDEKWSVLPFKGNSGLNYAVSNYGRVASFSKSITEGRLVGGTSKKGYRYLKLFKIIDGKRLSYTYYVHRLVAQYFVPKREEGQDFVIHLNYKKDDNRHINIKWATREEVEEHHSKNPRVIADRKRLQQHNKLHNYKLTDEKVKILKRKLFDPNRKTRLKMLARQFGVSEMQLHRIKTGENWGHVKIDKIKHC
ncbi:MAG: NUMOD4 domain-containing protein [Bacteroidales bacterium]